MQDHNWNDLRHVLALGRAGTLAAAGRAAGVNETTVARRIAAIERALGVSLFRRAADGTHGLTDAGREIIALAEDIEQRHLAIAEAAGQAARAVRGVVRLSSVPLLVNRVLVPALPALQETHAALTVELVPEARNLDLTRREADMALRFSRPVRGGLQVRARKLGEMRFAVYGPARRDPAGGGPDWIGYDDAHASLPQARWLARHGAVRGVGLRVADLETALEAVAAGLGKTLLPCAIAEADRRLARLDHSLAPPPPSREIWLLSHAEDGQRRSVAAVRDWLVALPWSAAH